MRKVGAYKCELTGAIFATADKAKSSEFRAMMKKVAGHLPAMGSVSATAVMEYLAGHLDGAIYPGAAPELLKALQYLLNEQHEEK